MNARTDVLAPLAPLAQAGPVADVAPASPLEDATGMEPSGYTGDLVTMGSVLLVTLLLVLAIRWGTRVLLRRYDMSVDDNLRAREMHTQAKVLSRIAQFGVVIIGVGVALMTFDAVEKIGASLLASAGVAGLVIGLAARPAVGNLIAGVQIALTQPIRLDDVVIIAGEWGWIEEINSAYVVVKVWDQRRVVVPLSKFIEEPFQNWTRTSAELLGTVFIHADYTVDVGRVREELKRLCDDSPLWDGRVAIIQVTDATEHTMQMRALVSAQSSPKLWDLRVYVREGLIQHLKRDQPEALPKHRAIMRREDQERPRTGLLRPDAHARGLESIGIETHSADRLTGDPALRDGAGPGEHDPRKGAS